MDGFGRTSSAAVVAGGAVGGGARRAAAITRCQARRAVAPIAPARLATIGVNAYLWRASLDTIAFMPIAPVDSNGGVIVTDWYVNPATPNERIKVTIAILDTDAARRRACASPRSARQLGAAGWVGRRSAPATVQKLEEIILGHARDLRRASIAG